MVGGREAPEWDGGELLPLSSPCRDGRGRLCGEGGSEPHGVPGSWRAVRAGGVWLGHLGVEPCDCQVIHPGRDCTVA